MNFSYTEVRHMSYGQWIGFFEKYKTIYNGLALRCTFQEPQQVTKLSDL